MTFTPLFFCSKPSRRSNIIYILADDLGYGDLGCYGQKNIKTPNLDKMAAEGIRFTDHYAGSTVCAPSRCCLMTGLDTGHARIRGNATVPLAPEDVTLPELLKTAGYSTGLIGKWGLGEADSTGVPNKKGFDYFFGYLNQIRAYNYYPDFLWRNEKKVKLNNVNVVADQGYAKGIGSAATKRVDYSHDLFSREALQFVEQNKDNPFFLYLAYTIPHANNEHWIVDQHGLEVPDYGEYAHLDWPEAQKGHAAMITRMDRDIGRLLAKLDELNLDQNTLVIFSSDNGPHREGLNDPDYNDSNGPLRGIKRDLYEGGIRVPMIVRWPGHCPAGATSNLPSAFWDIMPTLAEIVGFPAPENINGLSLLPTLTGKSEEQKQHAYLYWEFHEGKSTHQAIRVHNWKGIRFDPRGELELYDLSTDIGEQNNVAKAHPDIVAKIKDILAQARQPNDVWKLVSQL
ncbi:DUF4976 domain-containing protein [candidate division KSB1 bacterium]|nr:arylsulfatase [candidate division KSB1 bacterium]RQW03046.1 MAG: DUF4976 domain-containing protein [candidate division KSB1 bacterium]